MASRSCTRQPVRNALRIAAVAIALAFIAPTSGCFFGEIYWDDPFGREFSLEEVQKRYTTLVRWSAWHEAALYVAPEAREEFLEQAPPMKKLRITDYDLQPVDLNGEKEEATIRVTYRGYMVASPFEFEITETQHWKRHTVLNDWMVTPEFEGLDRAK